MAFMLLIVEKQGDRASRSEEQGRALYERMLRFGKNLRERGLLMGGDALATDSKGKRVSIHNGSRRIVDGPFAEAKEMVGGYFLLGCKSMEEAVDVAAECPAAQWATVEVREIATCFE